MTDRERENLRRRELLRRLAGAAAIAPAIQALVACGSEDPVVAPPPAPPVTPPTSTTMGAAMAKPPQPVAPPVTTPMAMDPKPTPMAPPPAPMATGGAAAPMSTGGAAAPMTGAMAPAAVDISSLACVVTPDLTEGPFFYDDQLERSDLLEGETEKTVTSGKVVDLVMGIYKVSGGECAPIAGAKVDIWQADTQGVYSAVPGGAIQAMNTSDKKFLRGWQTSGEDGLVRFKTIYPGFYGSRAIHIHFKIRVGNGEFTSQFFFDDTLNDKVLADAAYMKAGSRIKNRMDQVYTNTGPGCCPSTNPPPDGTKVVGDELVLDAQPSGDGYAATYKIGWMMA
jgi:protocatechuate 3,4-dioxygenase beta subunit